MTVPFVKMHGAANDFVVVDHREAFLPEDEGELRRLFARWCDRRRGVGADGVLLVERDPDWDFAMRYYNADGGPADYCGNGARCLARWALDHGLGSDGMVRFRTSAGVQDARRRGDRIDVHFGAVAAPAADVTLEAVGRRFVGRVVHAGVPHFVTGVEQGAELPIEHWGPALRRHPQLGPGGANVDFVARVDPTSLAMRTWERGVEGETLACGSGAIASALWGACQGMRSPVTIRTAGGDDLEVAFRELEGGLDVRLAGPVEIAFTGLWNEGAAHVSPSRA